MKTLAFAALLTFPLLAAALPVQLTCTSVTTATDSTQLTFDESNAVVVWSGYAPVRATFSSQQITWQMAPQMTNELDAYFVLNRMTGVLTRSQDVMQYNHRYATNVQQFNCAVAQQKF